MCEKVTIAIALVEMAKLVSSFLLASILAEVTKARKMKVIRKPR